MTAEEVQQYVESRNDEALLAGGFEEAFLGVAERCGQPTLAVYDADICVEILVRRDHMSYDDAMEFFEFNVLGSWCGEGTPLFLWSKRE